MKSGWILNFPLYIYKMCRHTTSQSEPVLLYFFTSQANQDSTARLASDFCAHVVFAEISSRTVVTSSCFGLYLILCIEVCFPLS